MSVIGIVGEYDPFHYGHKLHIDETRRLLGEDSPVVCVMSGDFIQRGEAAVYSKSARAEAAVKCGADLVLELPLPWALSSAEGFARGAVGILGSLGVVTHLSFGSECGDVKLLERLAESLIDPLTVNSIKAEMAADGTLSFAAARERALLKSVGGDAIALGKPNNILAVEYIKAIYDRSFDMTPVTVRRFGSGHDAVGESGPRSASELRARLSRGMDISDSIPETAANIYSRENELGRGPVLMSDLEPMIISRLRMLPDEAFARLPDSGAGLNNRLASACREETSLDAIMAATKSKRYALSRIRRMLMCAALGVTADMSHGIPPYARVLAATERGCALLKRINEMSAIPVLTKPAAVRELGRECEALFRLGSRAHDLFVLGYTAKEERRGGLDYRTSPKIV